MAGDAQAIREASSEIARQMQAFVQEMQNERSSRAEALGGAEGASQALADRLDALAESLRRMQVAADLLTDEMSTLPSDEAQAPAAEL